MKSRRIASGLALALLAACGGAQKAGSSKKNVNSPVILGGLDARQVQDAVHGGLPRIVKCYMIDREHSRPNGEVVMGFEIAPDGKVSKATVVGTRDDMDRCVEDVLRSLEFPRSRDGGPVTVDHYVLKFDSRPH